ncbi:hypothetical protein TRAPUB_12539 [Trametes pubescens]|uniref:Uncharacterized protein n=1 Tax=Trametes pubescens TaxID=154538 RepID=A0A1M2VTM5_TRAPU|nr:hypothetical protein TRAPUB_12539 [Trametes pubescens]
MLGELVREGRVRFEDERRILGHGLGVVLDATLSLALASVVLERELELAVRPLVFKDGTLVVVLSLASEGMVPSVLWLPLDSSEPEERAESSTAFMSAVNESSDEEVTTCGRGRASRVEVSDICQFMCRWAVRAKPGAGGTRSRGYFE